MPGSTPSLTINHNLHGKKCTIEIMSDYYEDSLNGLLEDLPCLIENKFFNELYSNLVISLSVLYSTLDAEYQHYLSSMCSLHEK